MTFEPQVQLQVNVRDKLQKHDPESLKISAQQAKSDVILLANKLDESMKCIDKANKSICNIALAHSALMLKESKRFQENIALFKSDAEEFLQHVHTLHEQLLVIEELELKIRMLKNTVTSLDEVVKTI